jgi:phosphomevalonate kinase
MTAITASAPGKAVLSGEYVVLDGASAVAVALDRRATVSISSTSKRCHQLAAPGLTADTWLFDDDGDAGLRWQDETASEMFGLFECVWRQVRPVSNEALAVRIDSSQFRNERDGAKLGLGSSAAVATSLAAGLQLLSGSPESDPAAIMRLAKAAHLEFQGGHGSGVDIATSVTGGIIKYEKDAAPFAFASAWPDGLLYRFLWSGKSAATADRIRKFEDGTDTDAGDESRSALTESAAEIALLWPDASAPQLLNSFARYTELLRRFSDEYQLGVFAAGHEGVSALASTCGIVYKPCGAGGGDIGIALALSESSLTVFCDRAQRLGFTTLDVNPDWQGVVIETESTE